MLSVVEHNNDRAERGHIVPRAMNARQAAEYVGLGLTTINKLRLFGGGPKYFKIGRRVAYERASLDAWLDERIKSSTSQSKGRRGAS